MGVRDRAVLGTLAGTGARVGAVSRLRLCDVRDHGDHRALRVREKRGLVREIPVRSDLDRWIHAYLLFVDDAGDPDSPLFRPLELPTRRFANRPMLPVTIRAMLKQIHDRRARCVRWTPSLQHHPAVATWSLLRGRRVVHLWMNAFFPGTRLSPSELVPDLLDLREVRPDGAYTEAVAPA